MNTQIKTLVTKAVNWFNVNKNVDFYAKADYFNGSHNDAENIFIELKKLIEGDHFHHSEFFYRRLNFLINEGIDVTSVQTSGLKKLVEEEIQPTPKKVVKTKKTVKKKVKKASKIKRDKYGRFIARR